MRPPLELPLDGSGVEGSAAAAIARELGTYALEGVGDEGASLALRVRAGLLLELAHGTGELVPDLVLRALEQLLAGLRERHPADPLQLALRARTARDADWP